MFKQKIFTGILLWVMVCSSHATTRYVNIDNPTPQAPYDSLYTAATTIQEAVDAASEGDTILVADGNYDTGGKVIGSDGTTNRIVIDKAITVQSINGPKYTTIEGEKPNVRCVWLGSGALLSGFTLIHGNAGERSAGGGVRAESTSSILSNCVVRECSAYSGGGMYSGQAVGCTFSDNSAEQTGGGIVDSSAESCVFIRNSASWGGGACSSPLNHCTLSFNRAIVGGGVHQNPWFGNGQAVNNSIIWNNSALIGSNWNSPDYPRNIQLNYCCTTPLPLFGTGNIDQNPSLVDDAHLSLNSPCIGAGSSLYPSTTDFEGDAWKDTPSIGCDEVFPGSETGTLEVAVTASYTTVAQGFSTEFRGRIEGHSSENYWDFSDGTTISNQMIVSHKWNSPGEYDVTFTAFNAQFPNGIKKHLSITVEARPTLYVDLKSSNPLPPYSSWETAATTIQDAIDASTLPGSLILVKEGIYSAGGRDADSVQNNRVVIDRPVTVQSLNGPSNTLICGAEGSDESKSVRCVWLGEDAQLIGFTLTNGCAQANDTAWSKTNGGGVLGQGVSSIASNCVLVANFSREAGGGASHVVLHDCTLSENSCAFYGGGAARCQLHRCVLKNNEAEKGGGGADYSHLENCLITGNQTKGSIGGGGTVQGILKNCSVVGNSTESIYGGGIRSGLIENSIIWDNTAPSNSNYSKYSFFVHCCTTPLATNGMNNISSDPLFSSSNDVHLTASSPCVDAGENNSIGSRLDLDGLPRLLDGKGDGNVIVDLGCYEYLNEEADSDGDQMNDGAERIAGTSLVDPSDYFHVEGTSCSGSVFSVQFQSISGRQYQLFWSTNLVDCVWRPVTDVQEGVGGTETLSDTNSQPSCFYRVGVSVP